MNWYLNQKNTTLWKHNTLKSEIEITILGTFVSHKLIMENPYEFSYLLNISL